MAFRADNVQAAGLLYFFVIAEPFFFFGFICRRILLFIGFGSGAFARSEFGVSSEFYIGSAPCHIGCDRNGSLGAGFGNNQRFARVVLCIQYFVPYAAPR